MQLQKQLSRRVEGVEYPKYVITISPKDVERMGWKAGDKLKTEIKDRTLIITLENE